MVDPAPDHPPGMSRFQLATAAVMLVAGAIVYPFLPETIPQHWDAFGRVDRWAPRSLGTVFFPVIIVLAMAGLFWLLPRIDPFRKSYLRFAKTYTLVVDFVVAFMAFVYAVTLYGAFHPDVQVRVLVPFAVGLLFAAIGNQMSKMERNFFMGIRTPWTLASERVWKQTHLFGARVFVAAGLTTALSALLPPPYSFFVLIVILTVATAAVTVASYVIYTRLDKAGELDRPMGASGG